MDTEVVKGTASAVRYTIDVRGDRDGVSTKHHTIFKVGDTTVMFTSGSPPIISDGDQLVVAGRRRGPRMLVCEAYINRTAMIRGDSGLWYSLIGAALMIPVGAGAIAVSLLGPFIPALPRMDLAPQLMLLGAGLCFFIPGLFLLYRWVLIRRAVKLLKGG
jgi:hypothetical protein